MHKSIYIYKWIDILYIYINVFDWILRPVVSPSVDANPGKPSFPDYHYNKCTSCLSCVEKEKKKIMTKEEKEERDGNGKGRWGKNREENEEERRRWRNRSIGDQCVFIVRSIVYMKFRRRDASLVNCAPVNFFAVKRDY